MTMYRAFLAGILALTLAGSAALAQDSTGSMQPSLIPGIAGDDGKDGKDQTGNESSGLPVDAQGNPAVDPTANVIALSEAATQRQDDLREASERFILARIEASERLEELREVHAEALRVAENTRVNEIIELRADYEGRLAAAEAKRIDAIRTVDVNAVAVQNQRAVEQAALLQTNATQSADTLRNLVANTATTVASAQDASNQALSTKIDQAFNGLQTRVAALEQAQYVGQGRSGVNDPAFAALVDQVKALADAQTAAAGRQTVTDPAIAELTERVKALTEARDVSTGQSLGTAATISLIVGGVAFISMLLGMIGLIVRMSRAQSASLPVVADPIRQRNTRRVAA